MSSQDVRSRVEKFARIADAAYYNQNRRGLRRILEADPQTRGFRVDELLTSDESLVLYNPQTREVVISFRGTVPTAKDLSTDLAIGLGVHTSTKRYRQSLELTRIVQQKYGAMGYNPVEVAGHSLGGGIAAFVANQDGSITAHVYNGAISLQELFDDRWDDDDTAGIIYSNSTRSDPVSAIQGIAATHGSAVVNNRIRQIWLPASNGNGVIQAHTIEGNFYQADSRADYWHPYRYNSSHMRKPRGTHKPPVIQEVKRAASNKEKRAEVKKAFEKGRDIVELLMEETAEEVPYESKVSRVVVAQKLAKGAIELAKIARKPEDPADAYAFENKLADILTDAAAIATPLLVIPDEMLKAVFLEFKGTNRWEDRNKQFLKVAQAYNVSATSGKYVQAFGQGFDPSHPETIQMYMNDRIVPQEPTSLQVPPPNLRFTGSRPMN